jgi:hypothetical protein
MSYELCRFIAEMCERRRIKNGSINAKEANFMSAMNDVANSINSLVQSGDIRVVVDIALIVMVVWFVARGVSRVFETIVLGGITLYAVYHLMQYLGIEVDYQAILTQVSYYLQQLIAFVNSNLPR